MNELTAMPENEETARFELYYKQIDEHLDKLQFA